MRDTAWDRQPAPAGARPTLCCRYRSVSLVLSRTWTCPARLLQLPAVMGLAGQAASTLAMAAAAVAGGAALGAWGLPLARGEATGAPWALGRYSAWLDVLVAHVICLAALAGIVRRVGEWCSGWAASKDHRGRPSRRRRQPTLEGVERRPTAIPLTCRLGSHKSIGPNAQLAIFHDASAMVGTALAVALHGSAAAWPLAFLACGRLLVSALHALGLRRQLAFAAVWAYAAAALALNSTFEGAGAAFWCERLLGAAAAERWMGTALALDRFRGVAPPAFSVAWAFRYTLMRFIRWVLALGSCVH